MEKINSKETLIRLIDQYQNLVFSVCLKMTGDYFTAEDLTQETFLSAYRHLNNGPLEAEIAWLCRIAANKCIDYCRAAARKAIPTEEEIHTLEDTGKKEPLQQVLNSEILEELCSSCNALAPPNLSEHLVKTLEQEKINEFRRYRFRVLTTAAAAILVVLLLPAFENRKSASGFSDWILVQETTRQESFQQEVLIQSARTDSKILEAIFGGTNIFADNSRFNLFRE